MKNNRNFWLAASTVALSATLAAYLRRSAPHSPLAVAPNVDLQKYMGEWFEIAHLPELFEKSSFKTKAQYTLLGDGSVEVVNSCHEGTPSGPLKKVKGRATVADSSNHAKLQVQFFWPFKADYWILDVDDEYRYALVGDPSRDSLWMLSRKPALDLVAVQQLTAKAQALGFNTQRLLFTAHK